jgi:DNA-binding response OmpR family regulator
MAQTQPEGGKRQMQESILLVEDDADINEMIYRQLTREGYAVTQVYDGEQAEWLLQTADSFDLILLDLMLPKRNGLDLLQLIRRDSVVPVLILSARDSDLDKALGLGFCADDYIAKPFSMIELVARVKAALRRAKRYSAAGEQAAVEPNVLRLLDLVIDPDNFTVIKDGQAIQLTAKEFQILKLFASNPNRVYTKEQIYRLVWNDQYYGDDNVINVHMRRLREKIESNPSRPKYIKTLWGIGYKAGGA